MVRMSNPGLSKGQEETRMNAPHHHVLISRGRRRVLCYHAWCGSARIELPLWFLALRAAKPSNLGSPNHPCPAYLTLHSGLNPYPGQTLKQECSTKGAMPQASGTIPTLNQGYVRLQSNRLSAHTVTSAGSVWLTTVALNPWRTVTLYYKRQPKSGILTHRRGPPT
jgi:hypothetical protein